MTRRAVIAIDIDVRDDLEVQQEAASLRQRYAADARNVEVTVIDPGEATP